MVAQIVSFERPSTIDDEASLSLIGATIIVDEDDFPGIKIAARSLAHDFGLVSRKGDSPVVEIGQDFASTGIILTGTLIVIGSIRWSETLRDVALHGNLDIDAALREKNECFTTHVVRGWTCPGTTGKHDVLVIAGSDQRGAIYGAYSLSEQIGVSPWHWWADVPAKHHPEIFALPVSTSSQEPSIKFRGMFINDEAPSLTGMVHEKFGGYNSDFYRKVFDLLLRLKANFLWPAMWPGYPATSFFVDDPENQRIAHEYGIMMSTSHHEPMQRLSNEWFTEHGLGSWNWDMNKEKITDFFREGIRRAKHFGSYFTMGMRGEYDTDMESDDPVAVVNDVIATQRRLIKEHHGREDSVPQLMALYKEVQEYWDAGRLKVPDDVTLLFADDNFGSLRRLPTETEKTRKGGAGIYYHFEYVGHPRSYKWLNPNSLGKTWHQLQEAYRRHARQIWVFNLGDIKPMEVPFTFAMSLAYDINSIAIDGLPQFYKNFGSQTFGAALSGPVAEILDEYHRLVAIRRHEHIEAGDFSLYNYNEANTILDRWENLLKRAETIYTDIDQDVKAAFYELVLHPVKASTIYVSLRVHQTRNQLWAVERRNSANSAFHKILELFGADFALSQEFHQLLGGKWNHMMSQTHYGLGETWRTPNRDMISGLCYVQSLQDSVPAAGQMGVAIEGHPGVRPGFYGESADYTRPSRGDLLPGVTLGVMTPYGPATRWSELYTRGTIPLKWECRATEPWVKISETSGIIRPGEDDIRLLVSIAWDQVPVRYTGQVKIIISSTGGAHGIQKDDYEELIIPIANRRAPNNFPGYIETAGYVSMPATQPTGGPRGYLVHPSGGRNGHGLISVDPKSLSSGGHSSLTFNFFTFEANERPIFHLYFNMTLDLDPTAPMEYELSLDGRQMENYRLLKESNNPGELPPGWDTAVMDCAWHRPHRLGSLRAGAHKLRVRLLHTNVLFEKVVVDLGGMRESYLGPPTSVVTGGP